MENINLLRIYKHLTIGSMLAWFILNIVYIFNGVHADNYYYIITLFCIVGLASGIYLFYSHLVLKSVTKTELLNEKYSQLVESYKEILELESVFISKIDKDTFERIRQTLIKKEAHR